MKRVLNKKGSFLFTYTFSINHTTILPYYHTTRHMVYSFKLIIERKGGKYKTQKWVMKSDTGYETKDRNDTKDSISDHTKYWTNHTHFQSFFKKIDFFFNI